MTRFPGVKMNTYSTDYNHERKIEAHATLVADMSCSEFGTLWKGCMKSPRARKSSILSVLWVLQITDATVWLRKWLEGNRDDHGPWATRARP